MVPTKDSGHRWFDFVRNDWIHQITQQPPLSATDKSRRLSLSLSLSILLEWTRHLMLAESFSNNPRELKKTIGVSALNLDPQYF